MSEDEKQNIVVVGGGAAGTTICRRLSSKLDMARYNLILITATPYYTHFPACIRMLVTSEGAPEDYGQIAYDSMTRGGRGDWVSKCRVVIGKVTGVEEDTSEVRAKGGSAGCVVLDGMDGVQERVRYSILVLATGCRWDGPLALPETKEETQVWVNEWRDKFEKAEDIVIVGGGASALEFAGEIRDLSQTKRITIVHDQPLLLNDAYPDSFRKAVAKNVRRRDVGVILNDSIQNLEISEGSTIQTDDGRLLVADLVVPCWGPKPNTGFISGLGPGAVVDTGHVRVLPTLQCTGHPRIFAAGDIIDWDEQKQAEKYGAHADVVFKNVLAVLKDKQPDALYHGCYETIVIPNGQSGGSTYYSFWGPEIQLGDLVSSVVVKSKAAKVYY